MSEDADAYFTEWIGEHTRVQYRVRKPLFSGQSAFQAIDVLDLRNLGRTLFLDRVMQAAEADEFIYHESLVHPAMLLHPDPRTVLVAGGGDGGVLREVFKHPGVERVVLAELDPQVPEVSREWLPSFSAGGFDDPRLEQRYGDAREAIQDYRDAFDVIVLDLTEPQESGPSRWLFTREFFEWARQASTSQGVVVAQAADVSPGKGGFLADLHATLNEVARSVRPFHCPVPSFLGIWGFAIATWHSEAHELGAERWQQRIQQLKGPLHYLSASQLAVGFEVPPYLEAILRKGQVRTDASPFIWSP